MAITVQLTTNAGINNNGGPTSRNVTYTATLSGSNYTDVNQTPGISGFTLVSSSLANNAYDWIQFTNLDITSSVTIAKDSSGVNVVGVLPPLRATQLTGLTGSFYLKSFPSSSLVHVIGSGI